MRHPSLAKREGDGGVAGSKGRAQKQRQTYPVSHTQGPSYISSPSTPMEKEV